jgi:hypothetical protein
MDDIRKRVAEKLPEISESDINSILTNEKLENLVQSYKIYTDAVIRRNDKTNEFSEFWS